MNEYMELAKAEAASAARRIREELVADIARADARTELTMEVVEKLSDRITTMDPALAETFYRSARASLEANRDLLDTVLTKFEALVGDVGKVRDEFSQATGTVEAIRTDLPLLVKDEAIAAVEQTTAEEVQKLAGSLRETFQPVMDGCAADFQKVQARAETLAAKLAKGVALSEDILKRASTTVAAVEDMKDSINRKIGEVDSRMVGLEKDAGVQIAKALSGVPDLMKAMVPMPAPQQAPVVTTTTSPGTMIWRGAWQAQNRYNTGDVVVYGGATYVATKPTKAVPGTSTDWSLFMASSGGAGFTAKQARNVSSSPPAAFYNDVPPSPDPKNWVSPTGIPAHVRTWYRTTDNTQWIAVQDAGGNWIWAAVGSVAP